MSKLANLCFFLLGMIPALFSQDTIRQNQDTTRHNIVPGKILNGDTLPYIDMKTVVVFPEMNFSSAKDLVRYEKLVYNVRKVYPYAKLAGIKLQQYQVKLDSISGEKERKKFLKNAEKELEAQFGDEIRDLTFTQGKILIKLVYRQTGNSTFQIVKELRGSFNAFIWQTLARIFGYDLKTTYDPEGEDKAIERIVQMIESGTI
ncbi:MAG: DUF4294 domain-containing protein [Bacteroidetes bacterium]|nr:DUF4294 domain-containing protein [Bacteroidota bacterium]